MEAKDIHKEILPMYGEHCLSRQAVHNWVQKFSEGQTSIEDEHWAGRPAFRENAFLTMMWLKEQCAHGSYSNQKNFTPQVSSDLWNGGTSV